MTNHEAKVPEMPEAVQQVLREFQDARRISNPHTRKVARDLEHQIKERMTIESAPIFAGGFELPSPKCLGFRNPNGITQLPDMGIYGYTADQMRAMYLAGLEAARQAVPDEAEEDAYQYDRAEQYGHNACRAVTLSNLTALVKEAQK